LRRLYLNDHQNFILGRIAKSKSRNGKFIELDTW